MIRHLSLQVHRIKSLYLPGKYSPTDLSISCRNLSNKISYLSEKYYNERSDFCITVWNFLPVCLSLCVCLPICDTPDKFRMDQPIFVKRGLRIHTVAPQTLLLLRLILAKNWRQKCKVLSLIHI